MADRPVKCSSCDVPAQVILEENIPQRVLCPRCGMSERYEEFQRSVGHQASAYASKELGKAFRDMARGNKNIRYKPGTSGPIVPTFAWSSLSNAGGLHAKGAEETCPPKEHGVESKDTSISA